MSKVVTYERHGDVHTFQLGNPVMDTFTVDYSSVPPEERTGLPKELLASSALACYGAMLGAALDARKVAYTKIQGKADIEVGPNSRGQGRVKKITLQFSVTLPEKDRTSFERCARIMENGCLITGSLHEGIEMEYHLDAAYQA